MRASSRLVLGWTSISLVAVVVGWAALDSVIETETPEPTEVAALDPAVLSPSPSAPPSSTPTALPTPATPSPSKAARVVQPANRPGPLRTPRSPAPTPSTLPTPSFSPEPGGTGDNRSREPDPPTDQSPDEMVRTVKTEGGNATIGFSDDQVYLVDYVTAPGYMAEGERFDAEAIMVRFLSMQHASTIHAYVDGEGVFRVDVTEEDG